MRVGKREAGCGDTRGKPGIVQIAAGIGNDVRPGQIDGVVEVGHGAAIPHRCRVAVRPEMIDRSVDGVSDAACSEFGAQAYFVGLDSVFARVLRASYRRSAGRRVGKGCVSTCRSRWAALHYKKKE